MKSQITKPFLLGLVKGDLPTECFQYWLRVDYPYLHNFVKVCALGMVKANSSEDVAVMLDHVQSVQEEMGDHEKHAKELGMSREDLLSYPMGPLKYSYTRHQLATAYQGSLGDTQAAILACQWGYGEAVRRLLAEHTLQSNRMRTSRIKCFISLLDIHHSGFSTNTSPLILARPKLIGKYSTA
jgi:thiaminase/transcriptional activator TenA